MLIGECLSLQNFSEAAANGSPWTSFSSPGKDPQTPILLVSASQESPPLVGLPKSSGLPGQPVTQLVWKPVPRTLGQILLLFY